MSLTLACGPMYDKSFETILLTLLLIKPLMYFVFISAFRYRVSQPIPMPYTKAIGLALARAGLGIAIIVVGFFVVAAVPYLLLVSWIYLYVARGFAWHFVGKRLAGLRSRRLCWWTSLGLFLNFAFDVALVLGAADGWLGPLIVLVIISSFLIILQWRGRRSFLRLQFSTEPYCAVCKYDLTGNLSGRCPECGTVIPIASIMKSGVWEGAQPVPTPTT